MKQIITTEKRPIKLWLDDIDDGAAGAYKNIDQVVENQIDLVEVVVTLHPLAVIKG